MPGSFSADITEFCLLTATRGDIVVRKLALEGLKGVVMRTPVDTGRCRGSWRVSLGTADLTVEAASPFGEAASSAPNEKKRGTFHKANLVASTQHAFAQGAKALAAARWGHAIYITNNLPYAPALEQGHSQQAPAGMLAVTFIQLEMHLARIVSQVKDSKNPAALMGTIDGGPA